MDAIPQSTMPSSMQAQTRPVMGIGAVPRGLARVIDLLLHNGIILVSAVIAGVLIGGVTAASGGDLDAATARLGQQ